MMMNPYFIQRKLLIIISVLFFMTGTLFSVVAQRRLSVTPMASIASFSADTFEVRTKITFKNMSAVRRSYVWERSITAWTNGWISFVCDANNCWSSNDGKAPKNIDLSPGGTGTLEVVLRPNKQVGQAQLELKLHETGTNKNTQVVKLNFETKQKVKEENLNFKIYPNPTSDYFMLEGDGIDKVVIYNIIGREVRSYKVTEGAKFTVSDLPEGIYIVRLITAAGLPVKTIRLSRSKLKA